jgi:SAM-dependent methyltransferase
MRKSPIHLVTSTSAPKGIPVQPVLLTEARDLVSVGVRGAQVVWLNAGLGQNAALVGNVGLHIDPNPLVARAYGADAGATNDPPIGPPQRSNLDLDDPNQQPGGFHCAPAVKTGLADGIVRALIVDHLEFEADRPALAKEILRIVHPGGRVIGITYGVPFVAPGILYELAEIANQIVTDFNGLPIELMAKRRPVRIFTEDQRGPSLYKQHAASCAADLDQTIAYLSQLAVSREDRFVSFPRANLDTFLAMLTHHWEAPGRPVELSFPVSFDAIELE